MSHSTKSYVKDFRGFDQLAIGDVFNTASTNSTVDIENGTFHVKQTGIGEGLINLGDDLPWDIDDLNSIEFYAKLTAWNAQAVGWIGVAGDTSAGTDPDAFPVNAMFKITGANADIAVQTDDGTNDLSYATGHQVTMGKWQCFKIDFQSGVQTISPPGKSKGGKASVQFMCGDYAQYPQHIRPTVHMDMSAYAGSLQLFFGTTHASGSTFDEEIHVPLIRVSARDPFDSAN